MSCSLAVAGLLVDSWRDQSRQTEPSEVSLIALGAVKWESHRGEYP